MRVRDEPMMFSYDCERRGEDAARRPKATTSGKMFRNRLGHTIADEQTRARILAIFPPISAPQIDAAGRQPRAVHPE